MLEIPSINTILIPGNLLVGTELGYSVAQLDDITLEEVGTPAHLHAVNQVITDARKRGINVLTNGGNN